MALERESKALPLKRTVLVPCRAQKWRACCVCGSAALPPGGSFSPNSLLVLGTNKLAIILNFNLGYQTPGVVSVDCPLDRVWNYLGNKPAGTPGRGYLAPGNSWEDYLHMLMRSEEPSWKWEAPFPPLGSWILFKEKESWAAAGIHYSLPLDIQMWCELLLPWLPHHDAPLNWSWNNLFSLKLFDRGFFDSHW